MSDPEKSKSKLGRCCCALVLILLLGIGGLAGYLYWAVQSMRQGQPLAFEPATRAGQLDEGFLSAKFKANELSSKLLGGDAEVVLDEEELNMLLFSRSQQTEKKKARVLLEKDSLWLESVTPLPEGDYLNVRVHVALTLRANQPPQIELREGQVGDFELGFVTRPILEAMIRAGVTEAFKREPKLQSAVSFEVKENRAVLRYPPGALEGS